MKNFVCEICGSTDIVKKDSNFVCQKCGMKYTADEIRRMMTDTTDEQERNNEIVNNSPENNISFVDNEVNNESLYLEDNKEEKTVAKKNGVWKIITAVAVAAIIIVFVIAKFIVPASNYNNAMELMDAGKYTDAYEIFDKLGDYKDSLSQKSIALECIKKEQLKNCNTGDVIFVGNYYWIVLDRKELSDGSSHIFLMARDCVAVGDYGGNSNNPTWKNSSVRKWLNDTFIKEFSAREKEQIMVTEVENIGNLEYGIAGSDTTYDKFFIPSIEEVEDFLFSSDVRKASYKGDDVWWWLRSPGKKSKFVSYIRGGGKISSIGLQPETIYTMGIRPAMIMTVGGKNSTDSFAKVSDFSKHSNERNTVSYKSCFEETIKQLQYETSDSYAYAEYALWDINGDGIPELIAHIGTCEADAEIRVYMCDSGKSVLAGTIPGGHSYLAGLDNENALIVMCGHMGYESLNRLRIYDSKVELSLIYEKEVDPEEDYVSFVPLEMKSLAGNGKLSWDGNAKTGNDNILQSVGW